MLQQIMLMLELMMLMLILDLIKTLIKEHNIELGQFYVYQSKILKEN
jgi:hypothetical protein